MSMRLCVLAVLLVACAGAPDRPEPSLDRSSQRTLPSGPIVGASNPYGAHQWRGIPYARPPVGELRWRAPQPAELRTGEFEALAAATPCPQYASVFAGAPPDAEGVIGSEDCLTLDVFAPRFEPGEVPTGDERLPVMLWIHGGGNTIGMSSFYDGGHLAQTQNVVLVAIQYRLGPLGWLRHESLRAGASPAEASGNFGTLDTIRALEWVRDNIAGFGGDPGNVTVFGESAGGRDTFALLASPPAEGLFHRAIVQSGGLSSTRPAAAENFTDHPDPGRATSSSEILAKLLVEAGETADPRAWIAKTEPAGVAAFWRSQDATTLLEAYLEAGSTDGMLNVPQMFADGAVIPADGALSVFESGDYHQVPVMLGTNRDENRLFMALDPEFSRNRLGLFPVALDWDVYEANADALARAWKARAVDEPARVMRARQGPSVYAYRWDWDELASIPLLYDGARMIGAGHGLEIAFVFGHFDLGPKSDLVFGRGGAEAREKLSNAMMSYWAQFAATGSPSRGRQGDLPEWKAWDDSSATAPRYAVLDTEADGGIRMSSETLTSEQVIAEALADERLPAGRTRCGLLRRLVEWNDLSRDHYPASGVCAEFAFDDYPWTDVASAE